MEKLFVLLGELEETIPMANECKVEISTSPVGWHIDHSLLVINTVIEAVKNSNEVYYKWRFNFLKTFVYAIGKIPRGKVTAPHSVRPKTEFNKDRIMSDLNLAKANIKALDNLSKNSFFVHPYFGNLNVKPTRKFLLIHTKHHLKIIQDILK